MTQNELNDMFSSARKAPASTSVEEVTAWVGIAAATSVGVLGIAAKLKLFIAKKSLFMLVSIISATGIVGVSIALYGFNNEGPEPANSSIPIAENYQENNSVEDPVFFADMEDSLEPITPEITEEYPPVHEPLVISVAPLNISPLNVNVKIPEVTTYTPPNAIYTPVAGVSPVPNAKNGKKVKGSGVVTKETRSVKSFKEIEINGFFDVIITQGSKESVTVEADDNIQQYIVAKNEGDRLVLEMTGKVTLKKTTKMNIYVTVDKLTHIFSNGIGDISSENTLEGKTLYVNISGVGDADLKLNHETLKLDYEGVGDVNLQGKVVNAEIESSGVGDVRGFELITNNMDLEQSGVGDAHVYAKDKLEIDFSGVGSVEYKGNPTTKDIDKSGIGSVRSK